MLHRLLIFFILLISSMPLAREKLVKLDTRDLEIDYFDVRVEEISRNDSVSVVQITRSSGPSGDESLFVIRALCVIARERGKHYFVILQEGENNKGVYTYSVAFLKTRIADLRGRFGITDDRPLTEETLMDSEDLREMFGW